MSAEDEQSKLEGKEESEDITSFDRSLELLIEQITDGSDKEDEKVAEILAALSQKHKEKSLLAEEITSALPIQQEVYITTVRSVSDDQRSTQTTDESEISGFTYSTDGETTASTSSTTDSSLARRYQQESKELKQIFEGTASWPSLDRSSTMKFNETINETYREQFVRSSSNDTFDKSSTESDIERKDSNIILPRLIEQPLYLSDLVGAGGGKINELTDRELDEMGVADRRRYYYKQIYEKRSDPGFNLLKKILQKWREKRNPFGIFDDLFIWSYDSSKACGVSSQGGRAKKKITFIDDTYRFFQYFMICMCEKYDEGYWDINLHGKNVYQQIGRRITDEDIPIIFEFLNNNREIKYVDLCYNEVTSVGLTLIALYLTLNHSIIGLNLMCNNIDKITNAALVRIGKRSNLKQLRLNGNPLKNKGRINAARLLTYNKLELLDLGETQNIKSLAWLAETLRDCTSIKVLDISSVLPLPLYRTRTYAIVNLISNALRLNKSLVEFHLRKSHIADSDVEILMNGLTENKHFKVLDLSYNNIHDFGAEIIAKRLHTCPSLYALLLAGNQISNHGARSLSLNLPGTKIGVLNVSMNKIGDSGMIDLLRILHKPYPIVAFSMFGNPFGNATLKALDFALKNCLLSEECVDTHVNVVDDHLQMARYVLGDRYKARYYRQHEEWNPSIWRWNGTVPMYCGFKPFHPLYKVPLDPQNIPIPTKLSNKHTCGI
ncbi:hypothetical protein O3M35_001424 [Rhynocoris fuscipes]|uniref:Leucine-rich repeat-containing protein 34 n=1 Tax=Rhynocoris fuscipes TaxID=488301 RepID=A0AAW1CTF2_9HEMI